MRQTFSKITDCLTALLRSAPTSRAERREKCRLNPRELSRSEMMECYAVDEHVLTFRPRTRVEHVYPSAETLPANTLRLYVYLSAPMSRGKLSSISACWISCAACGRTR